MLSEQQLCYLLRPSILDVSRQNGTCARPGEQAIAESLQNHGLRRRYLQ